MRKRLTDTLTNASYLLVAIPAVLGGHYYVAAGLVVLAIASAAFHWFRDEWDALGMRHSRSNVQRADEIGMYAALTPLVMLTGGYHPEAMFLAFALAAAFHGLINSFALVGVLVAMVMAFTASHSLLSAACGAALFGAAFAIRNHPKYWWGHGAWHVLTAAAYLVAYLAAVQ